MITEQQARDFIDLLESNKYKFLDISIYLDEALKEEHLIDFKSKTASQIIDEIDQIRKKYKDLDIEEPSIRKSIPKNIASIVYAINEKFNEALIGSVLSISYVSVILETLGFFRFHGKESALNTKYIEKLMRVLISSSNKKSVNFQYTTIKTTRLGITALSDSARKLLKDKQYDLYEDPFSEIYSINLYTIHDLKTPTNIYEVDKLLNYLLTFGFDNLVKMLNNYEIQECLNNRIKCYVKPDTILKLSNYQNKEVRECIRELFGKLNEITKFEDDKSNTNSIVDNILEETLSSDHALGIVNVIATTISSRNLNFNIKNKIDSKITNIPSKALNYPNFTLKMTEGYRKNWNSQPNPYILSKIYTEKRVREYISSIKHLNILHEAFSEDTIKYLISLGLSKDDFKVDKTEIIVEYNLRYDYGYVVSQFSNPYTKTYKSFFKEDYYEIFKNLATSSKDFGVLRMLIGKSTDEIKEAGELFREGLLVWTFNFQNKFKDTRVLIQYSNVLKYFKCRVKNLQNIFPKVFKIKD